MVVGMLLIALWPAVWQAPADGGAEADEAEVMSSEGLDYPYSYVMDTSYNNPRAMPATVRLYSTEDIIAFIEELDDKVTLIIGANCTADTTSLLMDNLRSNTTYYMYQDGVLLDEMTTDGDGTLAWDQDISTRHDVAVQVTKSTVYIKSDGTVSPVTAPITVNGNVYTLTANISDTLSIQRDGIVVIGNGKKVTSLSSSNRKDILVDGLIATSGVSLYSTTNVTIMNCTVSNPTRWAIDLQYCTLCRIVNNTIQNTIVGVYVQYHSTGNRIENNTIMNLTPGWNQGGGVSVYYSSNDNAVCNNTVNYGSSSQLKLWSGVGVYKDCDRTTISDNNLTVTMDGLEIEESKRTTSTNNTLFKGGLFIKADNTAQWMDITSNRDTVNGKPIYLWKTEANAKVPSDAGQVILYDCSGIEIDGLSIDGIAHAVQVAYSDGISISNLSISNTTQLFGSFLNDLTSSFIGVGLFLNYVQSVVIENITFKTVIAAVISIVSPNVRIQNCTFDDCMNGITLRYCSYNKITGNIHSNRSGGLSSTGGSYNWIANNSYRDFFGEASSTSDSLSGIHLYSSSYNIVENNTMRNTTSGIYVSGDKYDQFVCNDINGTLKTAMIAGSSYSKVIDNRLSSISSCALDISYGSYSTVLNNTMEHGGLGVSMSSGAKSTVDVCNTVAGKPIHYWKYRVGETVPEGAGQVFLFYCSNVVVAHQRFSNTTVNVGLSYSDHCLIWDNTMNCSWYGVQLYHSDNNRISENQISPIPQSGTQKGILLDTSKSNEITNNSIVFPYYRDDNYGISLSDYIGNLAMNNTISNACVGIIGYYALDNIINGNTILSSKYGIMITQARIPTTGWSNRIENNTITNSTENGIYLTGAYVYVGNNTIMNSTGVGLNVSDATYTTISNNTFIGNSILINTYNQATWDSYMIDSLNTVNGKPIIFFKNKVGGTISSQAGMVILTGCEGIGIENQNLSGSTIGIYAMFSKTITISNCVINDNSYYGAFFYECSHCSILNCSVIGNKKAGLEPSGAKYFIIHNNSFSDSLYGIGRYYDSRITNNTFCRFTASRREGYAFSLESNCLVENNTITDCTGISVLNGNTVSKNIISRVERGIEFGYYSSLNRISWNYLSFNKYALYCDFEFGYDNQVTNNTIIGNTYGTFTYYGYITLFFNNFIDNGAYISCGNTYDDGHGHGNYWSDYTGLDDGSGGRIAGDGIGDTNLPHKGYDKYPYMSRDGWRPLADAGEDQAVWLGDSVALDGSASSDLDGSLTTYVWDLGDGSAPASGASTTYTYDASGVYTVTLTVTDNHGFTGTDTLTVTVLTPEKELEELIEIVEGMDLPDWTASSLTSKLDNVISSLYDDQDNATINKLEAFINEVEAQRGKKLTEAQADELIALANQIIDSI